MRLLSKAIQRNWIAMRVSQAFNHSVITAVKLIVVGSNSHTDCVQMQTHSFLVADSRATLWRRDHRQPPNKKRTYVKHVRIELEVVDSIGTGTCDALRVNARKQKIMQTALNVLSLKSRIVTCTYSETVQTSPAAAFTAGRLDDRMVKQPKTAGKASWALGNNTKMHVRCQVPGKRASRHLVNQCR